MERATPSKGGAPGKRKETTAEAVDRIRKQREDRRRSAEHSRRERDEEVARIEASGGAVGDTDFMRMITAYREEHSGEARKHDPPGENDICVVVRKRPINEREKRARDWDSVTILNPRVIVHAPKMRVDGITKYLENTAFNFDHTFDEASSTEDLYKYAVMPLVAYAFQKNGHGTCLAYGQTGSGKTFTMSGIHELVARDVFRALASAEFRDKGLSVHVSFLEIYGARCSDLLHNRNKVVIREDGKQRVVAAGLQEDACSNMDELLGAIERGHAERATHATEVNSQSSRSHAVCEISIRRRDGRAHGSITMVDLAGSERAADSRNHSRQRRIEGAEINKSLLGLKECIRALAVRAIAPPDAHVHVPFRASKLTMLLKDSFTSDNARVVMIATVSPNASSADHTQNTLRYADRVKEKPLSMAPGALGDIDEVDEDISGEVEEDEHPRSDLSYTFLQATLHAAAGAAKAAAPALVGPDVLVGPRVSPMTVSDEAQPGSARASARDGPPAIARVPSRGAMRAAEPAPVRTGAPAMDPPRRAGDGIAVANAAARRKSGDWAQGGAAAASARKARVEAKPVDAEPGLAFVDDDGPEVRAPPARVSDGSRGGTASGKPAVRSGAAIAAGRPPASEPVVGKAAPESKRAPEPAAVDVQPAAGFRRLLRAGLGLAPSNPAGATESAKSASSTKAAPVAAVDAGTSARSRLRDRGRPAAGGVASSESRSHSTPPRASAPVPEPQYDDDSDGLSPLGALGGEDSAPRSSGIRSFVPLPGNRAGNRGPSSPQQRDLEILHASLRRDNLRSRDGAAPDDSKLEDTDEDMLEHQATVGMIVEEEDDLLAAHMSAIQENAKLITEEGQLLSQVQGRDVVDYDIDEYASKLHDILYRRLEMTQGLLRQLDVFRQHLRVEEQVASRVIVK